ncbi:MAG: hypothetical protein IPQ18_14800 [Saprospiraceae bacterium]|nr:hypothetical protein [Saprospiraceae bacterium]
MNIFKGCKALRGDNEMNRFIAIQSLDYLGFETTEAENGKNCNRSSKAKYLRYIILMDIQMPVMDGVEGLFISEKYWD